MLLECFSQTKLATDPSGRFNIGESFLPKPEETVPPSIISIPAKTVIEPDPDKYCQICNISVTSQPQMKLHLEGSKHAKKLKAIGTHKFYAMLINPMLKYFFVIIQEHHHIQLMVKTPF